MEKTDIQELNEIEQDELDNNQGTKKKKRRALSRTVNILLICVIFVLLAVIVLLNTFRLCPVYQESMYPTVLDKQRVILLRTKNVDRGDVFVFESEEKDETGTNKNLIKRVIAVGGDRILFVSEFGTNLVSVYLDTGSGFSLLSEPYVNPESPPIDTRPSTGFNDYYKLKRLEDGEQLDLNAVDEYAVTVASNHFYAMGDNRNESKDSRSIGFIPREKIVGKMVKKLQQGSSLEKLLRWIYRDKGE